LFLGLYYHRLEEYTDLGHRNDLFINDGTGVFTLAADTTFHDAGLLNTTSAAFLDYDLDGNLDLFVGNWFLDYTNNIYSIDRLYRGNGDGTFSDVTGTTVNQSQPSYGVSMADWNYDVYPDLFADNYCRGPGFHWQNNGDGTFTEVAATTNYACNNYCSWESMPRDFDNDGDLDLFKVYTHGYNNGQSSRILVNNNDVFTWEGVAEGRILGRAAEDAANHNGDHYGSWIDAQNNGLADFIITECGYGNNQLYYFVQGSDHMLTASTTSVGLAVLNDGRPPHPASPFDFDLDGDEDLIIGFASSDHVVVMRNDVGTQNKWIAFTLEGLGIPGKSNRGAVGARIEVTIGSETYTRSVYGGNGHFGPQIPRRLTFGLGQASATATVVIHWPNAAQSTMTLTNVPLNKHYHILEDNPVVPTLSLFSLIVIIMVLSLVCLRTRRTEKLTILFSQFSLF
jgi:hypothetical protein